MCIEARCEKCLNIWYPSLVGEIEKNQVCPECGNREDRTIVNVFDESPYPSTRNYNEEEA